LLENYSIGLDLLNFKILLRVRN